MYKVKFYLTYSSFSRLSAYNSYFSNGHYRLSYFSNKYMSSVSNVILILLVSLSVKLRFITISNHVHEKMISFVEVGIFFLPGWSKYFFFLSPISSVFLHILHCLSLCVRVAQPNILTVVPTLLAPSPQAAHCCNTDASLIFYENVSDSFVFGPMTTLLIAWNEKTCPFWSPFSLNTSKNKKNLKDLENLNNIHIRRSSFIVDLYMTDCNYSLENVLEKTTNYRMYVRARLRERLIRNATYQ